MVEDFPTPGYTPPPTDKEIMMAEFDRRGRELLELIGHTYADPIVVLVKFADMVRRDIAQVAPANTGRAMG